jgi:hypothetical protein
MLPLLIVAVAWTDAKTGLTGLRQCAEDARAPAIVITTAVDNKDEAETVTGVIPLKALAPRREKHPRNSLTGGKEMLRNETKPAGDRPMSYSSR